MQHAVYLFGNITASFCAKVVDAYGLGVCDSGYGGIGDGIIYCRMGSIVMAIDRGA